MEWIWMHEIAEQFLLGKMICDWIGEKLPPRAGTVSIRSFNTVIHSKWNQTVLNIRRSAFSARKLISNACLKREKRIFSCNTKSNQTLVVLIVQRSTVFLSRISFLDFSVLRISSNARWFIETIAGTIPIYGPLSFPAEPLAFEPRQVKWHLCIRLPFILDDPARSIVTAKRKFVLRNSFNSSEILEVFFALAKWSSSVEWGAFAFASHGSVLLWLGSTGDRVRALTYR